MKINLLIVILTFVIGIAKAQNTACTNVEEYFRGRLSPEGGAYGHPYTTFDRHIDGGFNFENELEKTRTRVINEKDSGSIFKAYQTIYNDAIGSQPTDDGISPSGGSSLAKYAKYCAFVFLVGLDGDGNYLDSSGGTYTPANRTLFKTKAFAAFDAISLCYEAFSEVASGEVSGNKGSMQNDMPINDLTNQLFLPTFIIQFHPES